MGKYYSATIQQGSSGTDVRQWQEFLKSQGYAINADGIFGPTTKQVTQNWQFKNGIGDDGIVGPITWGLAGFSDINTLNTPVSAPTIDPQPTAPTYDSTNWDDTEKGKGALDSYNSAKDAVNNYGDYTYGNQDKLDEVINSILNREKFSYDLNGDALYQQYKDKYIQQGKMAMGDAIGQASAMTGGYGNSYAQSVGQQAYQAQLDNLNDIVPELYAMALDKYNMDGQELYNKYGMLTDDYDRGYAKYQDGYNKLIDALGIARGDYYDGANMFYTEQANKNDVASKEFDDAMSIWQNDANNAWMNAEWLEDQRRYELEDYWKQKTFDATYGSSYSGGSSGGSSNDSSGGYSSKSTTPSGVNYDNGGLTDAQVKELQAVLGVGADGYYGPASKSAAGGLSAKEAYKKYVKNDGGESASEYADWDAGDWNGYFTAIRQNDGKAAAEAELNRMASAGLIPTKMMTYAALGARGGSLGH